MDNHALLAIFEQQAAHYDTQWDKIAPVYQGLYFMLAAVFADLPADARILCVGVGTGKELLYLAKKFPGWRFTAVEPASAMLQVCQKNVQAQGIAARCDFHQGILETLPAGQCYDAATCLLVSHFMQNKSDRTGFFRQIADRLQPSALLVNADLAAETTATQYDAILEVWQRMRSATRSSAEALLQMKRTYANDVAILPASAVAQLIADAGFSSPVNFYKAGLMQAWFSRKLASR